jgi:MoaA/NifB/PqqE/SkfB family radical SAM enzyme
MAFGKTFSGDLDFSRYGTALTFVVPATSCNLNCSFCVIKQRREATSSQLSVRNYVDFVAAAIQLLDVRVIGIQGYEPLLDEAWPFTEAILTAAAASGVRATLVTNGTYLGRRARVLEALRVADITISLDSATPKIHDALRRSTGAFHDTRASIETLLLQTNLRKRLTVASVMMPKRRHLLDGMPRLLAEWGVERYAVTPLLDLTANGRPLVTQDSSTLFDDLKHLAKIAEDEGIEFVVDDEFGLFSEKVDGFHELVVHRLSRPNRLLRLSPSGHCSIGLEVLRPVENGSPAWDSTNETASDFLRRRLALRPRPQEAVPNSFAEA